MENKYNKIISKIEVSEEFKNTIVQKMEAEASKRNGIIFKFKRILSSIMGALGIMACGGVVFAAVSGMLKIGERGILFSEEYANYEEKVENQFIEKEGTKIELVSKMCDDGFLVLQFEVELSDKLAKDEYGIDYLSFNDKIIYEEDGNKTLNLSGANYNLIIDGEEYWLKGGTDSQIIEKVKNKNYTVYQLYFLPADVIENKENFTITLDDVIIARVPDEGKFLEMDGNFEIEVSKQKALKNSNTIINENASVTYERLTQKIEKVSQTPMQTVIKVSSLFADVTPRNTYYLPADDYIGNLTYKVYDQDNNELFQFNTWTQWKYYWEDGRIQIISASEAGQDEEYGFYKYIHEEYIVTEKNENIKSIRIEVYENNEYKGIIRNIGTHFIDLEKEKITCKNKNEIVEGAENALKDYDTKGDFLVEDIEYFDIEIDEKYDYEITSHYSGDYENRINDYGEDVYNWIDTAEEESTMIIYNISLWNSEYLNDNFEIVLFKDKNLYNIYFKERGIPPRESIIVDENSEYTLAVFMSYEVGKIKKIEEIINTMKLKQIEYEIISDNQMEGNTDKVYYASWRHGI